MILKSDRVANLLNRAVRILRQNPQKFSATDEARPDPLVIVPKPRFKPPLEETGSSSVDLRLGTWFLTLRAAQVPCLKVDGDEESECDEAAQAILKQLKAAWELDEDKVANAQEPVRKALMRRRTAASEAQLAETHYIPFGGSYILHPGQFVLGVTLEWLRLPRKLAGSVIGKSSWGRRGLIIATATGVHPGFTGCLTLEITNVGEIPIQISPGMSICQLSLYEVLGDLRTDRSMFAGRRKPALGTIGRDEMANRLAHPE